MTKKNLIIVFFIGIAVITSWFFKKESSYVPNTTFTLLSGEKITTPSLKNKVYLVNFWATSCATCIKEMPQMINTFKQFKGQNFEFFAIAMDYDSPTYVENYARTRQLPFQVGMDDGAVAKAFWNVQLTPTTFLIDKKGKVLKRYVGIPNFSEMNVMIKKALEEKI